MSNALPEFAVSDWRKSKAFNWEALASRAYMSGWKRDFATWHSVRQRS